MNTDTPEQRILYPPKLERRKRKDRRFGKQERRSEEDRRRETAEWKDEERRAGEERRNEGERRSENDRRESPDSGLSKTVSRGVRRLAVFFSIAVCTGFAWLLFEWGQGTRFDGMAFGVWRFMGRLIQDITGMEPILAAIVFPLVVFPILIIGFFFYNRGRSD